MSSTLLPSRCLHPEMLRRRCVQPSAFARVRVSIILVDCAFKPSGTLSVLSYMHFLFYPSLSDICLSPSLFSLCSFSLSLSLLSFQAGLFLQSRGVSFFQRGGPRSSIEAGLVLPSRRLWLLHRGGSLSSVDAGVCHSYFCRLRRCPCVAFICIRTRGDAVWQVASVARG